MTGQTYECENFVVVLWGYNTASKNLTAMCVHKRNGKSSLIYTGKGKNLCRKTAGTGRKKRTGFHGRKRCGSADRKR